MTIGVVFGCFGKRIECDSWWFNHLPGPSTFQKGHLLTHIFGGYLVSEKQFALILGSLLRSCLRAMSPPRDLPDAVNAALYGTSHVTTDVRNAPRREVRLGEEPWLLLLVRWFEPMVKIEHSPRFPLGLDATFCKGEADL